MSEKESKGKLLHALNNEEFTSDLRARTMAVMAQSIKFMEDCAGEWGEMVSLPEEARERARLIKLKLDIVDDLHTRAAPDPGAPPGHEP